MVESYHILPAANSGNLVDFEHFLHKGTLIVKEVDGIPRRIRLDLLSPAETAIHQAIQAVEEVGAHPLLTEAVILLGQAKDKVSDYMDEHADWLARATDQ